MGEHEVFLHKLLQPNEDNADRQTPPSNRRRPRNFSSPEKTTTTSIARTQEKDKSRINPDLLRKLDQLSRAYHEENDPFRKGVLLYHLEQLEHRIQRHRWWAIL